MRSDRRTAILTESPDRAELASSKCVTLSSDATRGKGNGLSRYCRTLFLLSTTIDLIVPISVTN
jgi:hypothetical protein